MLSRHGLERGEVRTVRRGVKVPARRHLCPLGAHDVRTSAAVPLASARDVAADDEGRRDDDRDDDDDVDVYVKSSDK